MAEVAFHPYNEVLFDICCLFTARGIHSKLTRPHELPHPELNQVVVRYVSEREAGLIAEHLRAWGNYDVSTCTYHGRPILADFDLMLTVRRAS